MDENEKEEEESDDAAASDGDIEQTDFGPAEILDSFGRWAKGRREAGTGWVGWSLETVIRLNLRVDRR